MQISRFLVRGRLTPACETESTEPSTTGSSPCGRVAGQIIAAKTGDEAESRDRSQAGEPWLEPAIWYILTGAPGQVLLRRNWSDRVVQARQGHRRMVTKGTKPLTSSVQESLPSTSVSIREGHVLAARDFSAKHGRLHESSPPQHRARRHSGFQEGAETEHKHEDFHAVRGMADTFTTRALWRWKSAWQKMTES